MAYKKRTKNKQSVPVKRKKQAKRAPRKNAAPKTRNSGTMSESQFFQHIRHILRKASIYWKPISITRKAAQIPYIGSNKRRKWSYICSECKGEFDSKAINCHHIIPCGALNSFEDLPGFVERLFVEEKGLAILCSNCHSAEHLKEKE